jgi:5-methylcytosine-specific restriction endonuclease McrA
MTFRTAQIRRKKRAKLFERQGGICPICQNTIKWHACIQSEMPTLDHIIPKSMGGTYTMDNLRLVHWRCNNERGNRLGLHPWADTPEVIVRALLSLPEDVV